MLRTLSSHDDDHIVPYLASWAQAGDHYILFPLAKLNLGEFLEQQRSPQGELAADFVLWFFKQLKGLAQAVDLIHNLGEDTRRSALLRPLDVAERGGRKHRQQGYHHDLKPDNILVYFDELFLDGNLKIADFGAGQFHNVTVRTGEANSRFTLSRVGTPAFISPDCEVHGKASRPHDMWSLGCVFFELLAWVFVGLRSGGGVGLETERLAPDADDPRLFTSSYWEIVYNTDVAGNVVKTFRVKGVVREQMERVRTSTGFKDQFEDVMEVIDGLFLDEKERMKAPALVRRLTDILADVSKVLEDDPEHFQRDVQQASGPLAPQRSGQMGSVAHHGTYRELTPQRSAPAGFQVIVEDRGDQ